MKYAMKTAMKNLRIGASIVGAILGAATLGPGTAWARVGQPEQIISRPRTLPGGELEVGGGVDLTQVSVSTPTGTTHNTSIAAPLGLGYGINDDFEVRGFYAVSLRPEFTGKTFFDLRLAYTFLRQGPTTAAAQVRSGIDLGNNTVRPLRLGVNAQYNFTYNFALFTPGEQLTATLSGSPHAISLDLPVGVGWQATGQVFASLTTNVAHLNIANSSNAIILSDMIPISAAVFYSLSNALDLGAHLDTDLDHTEVVTIGVLARGFF